MPSPSSTEATVEPIQRPLVQAIQVPGMQAQFDARPFTLEHVTELALANNPILLRAQARIDAARGQAIQAGLPPNPRWDSNNPQVFAGSNSQYNAGIQQEIPVKGKLRLDRAAALQALRQAEIAYFQDRFALLAAVRSQFYVVMAAERRVEVLRGLIEIATFARNAAQKLDQAGEGTLTDVLLLEMELQRAQIATTNAVTTLKGQREQLAAIIGLPNLLINDVVGDLHTRPPDFDEQQLRQYVATQNTNIRIAQAEIDRTRVLLRRAAVEPYPNPYLGPGYAWGRQPGSQQIWLNFQFNIPVWNLNQGNVRAARANIRNATASLGTVRNDLLRQTADAFARYRASRDLADRIARDILPTAIRTQRLVQDGYVAGQFDVTRYLQAQRSLREIELGYIDTLEDVWTSAVELAGLLQLPQFP